MKRPTQPDLFPRPSRVSGAAQVTQPTAVEPFDFLEFDPRCVPQPGRVIPEEIRIEGLDE